LGSFWLLDAATWSEELDQTLVDPVVVRFHDTSAVFVAEPKQPHPIEISIPTSHTLR
jgi:hypothetical protein